MTQETRKDFEIKQIRKGHKTPFKYWTKEEKNFLEVNAKMLTPKEIGIKLGRSKSSVENQLNDLKISSKKDNIYISSGYLRGIVRNYKNGVNLRRYLRKIYKMFNVKDLDKIPDRIYCGGSRKENV